VGEPEQAAGGRFQSQKRVWQGLQVSQSPQAARARVARRPGRERRHSTAQHSMAYMSSPKKGSMQATSVTAAT
jgi:hypothetical protein